MAFTYGIWHDSALTTISTPENLWNTVQDTDLSYPPNDTTAYLGSPATGKKAQVAANPGVTAIQVSVVDASGGGAAASEVKLALSLAGLDSATPGAPLTLSTQVLSGVANAVPIWIRRTAVYDVVGSYQPDMWLETQELVETPV